PTVLIGIMGQVKTRSSYSSDLTYYNTNSGNLTSTSAKENVEPDTFDLTDNLNSSNGSMRVESLNAINCTDSSETPSNDPVRVETFDATSDVYDPLDL
ncbi:13060_t:CDS:2, partial [Acaulospora morrowiae]